MSVPDPRYFQLETPPPWWLKLASPARNPLRSPSPAEGWWGLLPLAVGLLLYLPPALASGWALDDWVLIAQHPHATDGSWLGEWTQPTYLAAGDHSSFVWRPLVATLWRGLGWAFGLSPTPFHLMSLALHLTNLLILQRVIRLWALRLGYSAGPAAAILALGWTLHPATPDVVGWVSSTFELGATLGVLMALRAGLRTEMVFPWIFVALLCKESALPAVVGVPLLAGLVTEARRRIWIESLGAGLSWWILHRLVTGQSGQYPMEGWTAWLQLLGAGWAPLRASMSHLFDPEASVQPGILLLVLGGLCLGVRGLRPLGLGGLVGAWMLLPAGFGVALIGIAPLRYLYLPLAMVLVPLGALPLRKVLLGGAGILLGLAWGPRAASRADEWRDEESLWQGELLMEAGNPVAVRQWVRYRWEHGEPERRPELLATWKVAIDRMPRSVQWFNPVDERFELAQAAFIVGNFPLAQEQVSLYLLSRPDAPPKAWCLLADSLEHGGGGAHELDLADRRCKAAP